MNPPPTARTAHIIGDAAFLACSWTWCIGMFLPVLLLQDFGPASFLAFAIPNILGAAAVAWWFKDEHAVDEFSRTHATAIRWFSLITLAFQWFFAIWIGRGTGLSLIGLTVLAPFIAVFFLMPASLRSHTGRSRVGLIALAASLGVLIAWLAQQHFDPKVLALDPAKFPFAHRSSLAPLAAVCALGFLTCPLLDGTFLAVRRSHAKGPARATFALGFVVFFALLIFGTHLYAPSILRASVGQGFSISPIGADTLVLVHMALQLGFTIAAHERVASARQATAGMTVLPGDSMTFGAMLAGVALALVPQFFANVVPALSNNEFVYRAFLVFYGLVFPVYILAFALPIGRSAKRPTPTGLAVCAAAVLGAGWFFWKGFIELDYDKLWPGVGIAAAGAMIARFIPGGRAHGPRSHERVPAPRDPAPPELSAHAALPHG